MEKKSEYLELNSNSSSPIFLINSTEKKTFSITPSDILSRVQNFLPILKQENDTLNQVIKQGDNVDIEAIDEAKEHIEMNIDVGVFDVQIDPPAEISLSTTKLPETPIVIQEVESISECNVESDSD